MKGLADWCPTCKGVHDSRFTGFRTGWHYTAFRNWRSIKREGIRPYKIKDEISNIAGEPISAVFVWLHPQTPREHAGSLLFHAVGKMTDKVVRFQISYAYDDIHRLSDGRAVWPYHHQLPEDHYWHDGLPAVLLKAVRPEQIVRVDVYDLSRLLRRPTRTRRHMLRSFKFA